MKGRFFVVKREPNLHWKKIGARDVVIDCYQLGLDFAASYQRFKADIQRAPGTAALRATEILAAYAKQADSAMGFFSGLPIGSLENLPVGTTAAPRLPFPT